MIGADRRSGSPVVAGLPLDQQKAICSAGDQRTEDRSSAGRIDVDLPSRPGIQPGQPLPGGCIQPGGRAARRTGQCLAADGLTGAVAIPGACGIAVAEVSGPGRSHPCRPQRRERPRTRTALGAGGQNSHYRHRGMANCRRGDRHLPTRSATSKLAIGVPRPVARS